MGVSALRRRDRDCFTAEIFLVDSEFGAGLVCAAGLFIWCEQRMNSRSDAVGQQLRYASTSVCRACGSGIEPFLRFGALPLANALVDPGDPADGEQVPLTATYCPSCHLVQLAETIDPAHLFDRYVYFSSQSPEFVKHAETLAHRVIAQRRLTGASQVIEIASNDGYLLQHYRHAGIPVLGIDPAVNIADVARRRGIKTICEFFSPRLAASLSAEGCQADVLHAHNVLAHMPDLNGVLQGIAIMMKADGIAIIEFPYLLDLIDRLEFDTIYHEHFFYFSLTPLAKLFARHGLQIIDVERLPVHGGSLRLFVARNNDPQPAIVKCMLAQERQWGVADFQTYLRFAAAVAELRPKLRELLTGLKARGHSIAAYGAAAKGATLLNYCRIGRDTIDAVFDRSPFKQGLAMPGSRIPIRPADDLVHSQPDYTLLLAWNFAAEIMHQQAEYRGRGGQFIVPVPEPEIVSGTGTSHRSTPADRAPEP
jgi:SAM-dependent methyltransferase